MADDKTETVQIRVSTLEKAAYLQAAAISGLSLSSWTRERLRRAARVELEGAGQPVQFIRKSEGN